MRRGLVPGDYVKIERNCERFWLEVTECGGGAGVGRVENDLVRSPDTPLGACVRFEVSEVLDVISHADGLAFVAGFAARLRCLSPAERADAACIEALKHAHTLSWAAGRSASPPR